MRTDQFCSCVTSATYKILSKSRKSERLPDYYKGHSHWCSNHLIILQLISVISVVEVFVILFVIHKIAEIYCILASLLQSDVDLQTKRN